MLSTEIVGQKVIMPVLKLRQCSQNSGHGEYMAFSNTRILFVFLGFLQHWFKHGVAFLVDMSKKIVSAPFIGPFSRPTDSLHYQQIRRRSYSVAAHDSTACKAG